MALIKRIANKINRFFKKRRYKIITGDFKKYGDAWKNQLIPEQQLKINKKFLDQLENSRIIKSLKEIFRAADGGIILEVGCSTGYYSQVFKKLGLNFVYQGCDYSQAFIDLAKKNYPEEKFEIMDAADLKYETNSFDTVFHATCLLHLANYEKAIAEAARVAKKYVIFSGLPIIHLAPTVFTEKEAYGVKMLEIFFNEKELFNIFSKNNLLVAKTSSNHYFYIEELAEPIFIKNYLCQKIYR